MTTRPTTTPSVARFPLIPVLLCALALSGCDKRDKTAQATEKSANQLQTTNPLAAEKYSQKQFTTVVTDLKAVSDQGSPGENAAALILTARSQVGLALQPAAEASAQERDSSNRALVISSHLGAWIEANARAASQEQFDPSSLIAESRKEAADKAARADATAQDKSRIDKVVADLRAQATAKTSQAQAEEDQYAALKERATKLTAIQAEPVIKQAAAHKHASDKSRTEAQLLDARADQVAPQSAEAQLQIDQFLNQKKNLEATATQLTERAAASKAEADAARAQAAGIAAEIDKALGELRANRAGPLNEAFQGAATQLQAAASTAQRAASAGSTAAKTTIGAAQQTLGDMHWGRAHGLEAYHALLATLTKVQPPLPQKDQYAKEAEETAAARKEALEAAKGAYESALSAFSSAPARGDSKDRLARLATQLEKIVRYLSGDSTDLDFTKPPPPAADEPAPAQTPAAAAPAGAPPGVLAAIERLFATLRDRKYSELPPLLYTPTPEEKSVAENSVKFLVAFERIDELTSAKFGKSLTEHAREAAKKQDLTAPIAQIVVAMREGMSFGKGATANLKAADAQITVTDDRATAKFPGSPQPMTFHLVDGAWLLDLGLDLLPDQQRQVASKAVPAMAQGIEQVAADVASGTLQSNQAVLTSLLQRLQPILAELMQQAKPPEGGGGG